MRLRLGLINRTSSRLRLGRPDHLSLPHVYGGHRVARWDAEHRAAVCATAAAPILLNFIMIATLILIMTDIIPCRIRLAWGVMSAGIGQPQFDCGGLLTGEGDDTIARPRLTPGVRRLSSDGAGPDRGRCRADQSGCRRYSASTLVEGSVLFVFRGSRQPTTARYRGRCVGIARCCNVNCQWR